MHLFSDGCESSGGLSHDHENQSTSSSRLPWERRKRNILSNSL